MTDLITLPRATVQQALEALESLFTLQADDARPKRCGDAITALKAALEQPHQFTSFTPKPPSPPPAPQDFDVTGPGLHSFSWRGNE